MMSARLEDAVPRLSERKNTPLYALTPNLGRLANSVGVRSYSAEMKCTGTFGDEELQGARFVPNLAYGGLGKTPL